MKATFVAVGSEQLAISLLSGILKRAGHEVSLAFNPSLFHDRSNLEFKNLGKIFDKTCDVYDTIRKEQPDVLLFSSLTATYQWMLEVARNAKRMNPGVKTVFGGVHVSAVPDRAIAKDEIDFVVVGEGEIALPQILNLIENDLYGQPVINTRYKNRNGEVIRGYQAGFNQDLDALPPYDKTIWEPHIRIQDKYMTMVSRGCPYRCSFCFNNFFAELPEVKEKGRYVRFRSVEHMIGELKTARKRYNPKFIDFQDDVFSANKKWLMSFLEAYKREINIPFQCLTHPNYLDEETGKAMAEAGCAWIQMGVQSMDEEFKHKSLQRFERSENIVEACRVMKKFGIKAKLDHMFALPNEPMEAQEKALQLYKQYVPDRIQTFYTCFLPGTDMMKEALEQGLVTPEEAEKLYEGENFYFHKADEKIKNREYAKLYRTYELIFKLLPILPDRLAKDIAVKQFLWVPTILQTSIAFVIDLILGIKNINPDFFAYQRYYTFHLRNFFRQLIGLGYRKAASIKDDCRHDDSRAAIKKPVHPATRAVPV